MSLRPHLLWSQPLPAAPVGLSLARETGSALVWDADGWLHLFNQRAQKQGQSRVEGLRCAAITDTGNTVIACTAAGLVRCLAPDFSTRREVNLSAPPLSLASDPFGNHLAVADDRAQVHWLLPSDAPPRVLTAYRPLHHLAFVSGEPILVGAAELGLVQAWDLSGEVLWRDSPLVRTAALSVDGAGQSILLSAFSDGIQRWTKDGKKKDRIPTPAPCRLLTQSYSGDLIIAVGLDSAWWVFQRVAEEYQLAGNHEVDAPILAMSAAPLGDRVWLALADRRLTCHELR